MVERSFSETLTKIGLSIEPGKKVTETVALPKAIDPNVQALHKELANVMLSEAGIIQVGFNLNKIGLKFLAEQGAGTAFLLEFPRHPKYTRPDGKQTVVYAQVHPDTNIQDGKFRLAMLADKSLWVPEKLDPYNHRLNPEDVEMKLGTVTTLGRGEHSASGLASTTEPSHVLSVLAGALPGSRAGTKINDLPENSKAHFADAVSVRGQEGLLPILSPENSDDKNQLLEDPLNLWPLLELNTPPPNLAFFRVMIDRTMVDVSKLSQGLIQLNKMSKPEAVVATQEEAFAQILRKGNIDSVVATLERRRALGW